METRPGNPCLEAAMGAITYPHLRSTSYFFAASEVVWKEVQKKLYMLVHGAADGEVTPHAAPAAQLQIPAHTHVSAFLFMLRV